MEDSKEIKGAASQPFWWEASSVKYEDLRERSDHWTLGADAATATLLQQISNKMIARTHEVEASLKTACENVDDLHVALANVTTSFHFLSNTQFTENRTYQEDERARDVIDKTSTTEASGAATQENFISSCREAIAEGLKLVNSSYLKVEISDSESEGDQQEGLTVYKRINPFEKRRLPHIIGSSAFYSDETVGLFEHPVHEDEQENDVETSSVGSVEVKDSSRPIVGNSSKIEVDDESDSDETFLQPNRSSLVQKEDLSSYQRGKETPPLLGDQIVENVNDFLKPSNHPIFNGVSSDSDDGGPLFGPSSSVSDSRNSISSREPPPINKEVDERDIVPEKSTTSNRAIPKRVDGPFGSDEMGSRGGKSGLFGSESDDDDGLFSTKKPNQSVFQKGTFSDHESRDEVKRIPSLPNDTDEGEQKNGDFYRNSNEDIFSETSSLGRKKPPVGGINIFNTAITRAIEKQQHSSGSGSENLSSSKKSERVPGSDHVISSRSSDRSSRKVQGENNNLYADGEKGKNSVTTMPSKLSSHNTKDLQPPIAVPPNKISNKPAGAPLFSDEEGLFSEPKHSTEFQPGAAVAPSKMSHQANAPLFSDEEGLFSATPKHSTGVLPTLRQESKLAVKDSGKINSLFSDSDDDLFKPARQQTSWRSDQKDFKSAQDTFFEPPPIPQSPPIPPPSNIKGRKPNTAKKCKPQTSIFGSSSSDDDIFTSRKPQNSLPGPKSDQSTKPSTFPGKQPVRTAANMSGTNPIEKSVCVTNESSKTAEERMSSVQNQNILTKNRVTISEEGTVGDASRTRVVNAGKPPPLSLTPSDKKIKSLFGTSDEDDDDDIFASKVNTKDTRNKNDAKVLTIKSGTRNSSEDDLFKSSEPSKVMSSTNASSGKPSTEKKNLSKGDIITRSDASKIKGAPEAVTRNRKSLKDLSTKSDILNSSDDDLFNDRKTVKGLSEAPSKTVEGSSSEEELFRSVAKPSAGPPKPVGDVGSSKNTSANAPSNVAYPKVNSSVTNYGNEVIPPIVPTSAQRSDVPSSSVPPPNYPTGNSKSVDNSISSKAATLSNEINIITQKNIVPPKFAAPSVSKGSAPPKISASKPTVNVTPQLSTNDSSDDDLFNVPQQKSSQNVPSKLSNSVPSVKKEVPIQPKSDVTNKIPTNKVPDASNNDAKAKVKNIFSSDSDEDIFKSSTKIGFIQKETKNIFSDTDEIDDIFSADFNKSQKSTDQSKNNISKHQSVNKAILQSTNKSTLQSSDKSKNQLNKSTDKSTHQSTDKSTLQSSDKSIHQSNKAFNKSTPQSSDKSTNESINKQILEASDKSTVKSQDASKVIQNSSINTPVLSNSDLAASDKSLRKPETKDLKTLPLESKVSTALGSKMEKPSESEKERSTSGVKESLFEDDDDDDLFGPRKEPVVPTSGARPEGDALVLGDITDGARISRVKDPPRKEDKTNVITQPKSVDPTKKSAEGVAQPVSPTKKPPVGGVALFGGNELLAKLKSRRKSSFSDNEDVLTPDEVKKPVDALPIKPTSVTEADISQESRRSTVYDSKEPIRLPVPSRLTIDAVRVASSPGKEMGVSFDETNRASEVLVSLNKNRPKIQHHRQPPSRSKRERLTSTGTDRVDSHVEKIIVEVNDDIFGEILHHKKIKSSTVEKSSTTNVEGKIRNPVSIGPVTSAQYPKTVSASFVVPTVDDVLNSESGKKKSIEVASSVRVTSDASKTVDTSSTSGKRNENVKSTSKTISVDDIFGDEDEIGKRLSSAETREIKKQTTTKKITSTTSIFDDDDEDIDDLFNAPKKKIASTKAGTTASTKKIVKVVKKEATSSKKKISSSLFSDDDDTDDRRLFSSSSSTTKTSTTTTRASTSKVTTGKQVAKRSSLFADEGDSSDSDLFSSGPSKVIKGVNSKKEDQKNLQISLPIQNKKETPRLPKEEKFVDPLMGGKIS